MNMSKPLPMTNSAKEVLWTQSYILTLIVIVTSSITMSMMMPILPIYIKSFGGNMSMSGIVISVFTFSALLCRPLFGKLLDTYERKLFLLIGTVAILMGCFSYQFANVIIILLILRVIHGIGYSASTNAAGTVAADVVPVTRRGEGIGYYGAVNVASIALGPAVGLMIMNAFNIKAPFKAATIIVLIGVLSALFINYEKGKEKISAKNTNKKTALFEPTALPSALVMLFIDFAYAGVVTYVPSYTSSLGLGTMGAFYFVYAFFLLATRVVVGKITDKQGMTKVIIPGIILLTITFLCLAFARSTAMFMIAAVLFGLGYGSIQPTLYAIVVSLCPPSNRGIASATFFSSMDLGIGLGALVWGILSQSLGFSAIYLGCILCMILASFAYYFKLRNQFTNRSTTK